MSRKAKPNFIFFLATIMFLLVAVFFGQAKHIFSHTSYKILFTERKVQAQSVSADLDCKSLGLTEDKTTGLCLPGNHVNPGADSIAASGSVGDVINAVLRILLSLGAVISVVFMVIGGYQYITSRGSEDAAKKGRSTMVAAIIGLIAVLLAYTIVTIVTNLISKGTGSLFS